MPVLAHFQTTSPINGIEQIRRRLLAWSDNDPIVDWAYVVICLLLTCMAGLMSGLTLGLLSLDTVELEVLLRSGTPKEQKYARKIMPIVSNSHSLLVSLLLCNALAMEALPLFLDKLADPVTAVIVSVTAVLFFGEIIPQSVCSRYGLAVGANLAPLVRLLMWLCSPVAWPMGRLLDLLLGQDHHTLFRRRQLKELVSIHAEDAGMGGALTRDEIKVITGALDLTSKVAYRAMTPLDKVFMLSSSDVLDEPTLRAVLHSGHSRIPVHREGDRSDVVGLVLVKELLQYRLGSSEEVPVAMLRMRSVPRLPATIPMYDMLRLFQTGRSHIAVLTQPAPGELQRVLAQDPSHAGRRAEPSRKRPGKGAYTEGDADSTQQDGGAGLGGGDDGGGGRRAIAVGLSGGLMPTAAARDFSVDDGRSVAAEIDIGDMTDVDGYMPYSSYYRSIGGEGASYPPSALDPQDSYTALLVDEPLPPPPSFRPWVPLGSGREGREGREDDGVAAAQSLLRSPPPPPPPAPPPPPPPPPVAAPSTAAAATAGTADGGSTAGTADGGSTAPARQHCVPAAPTLHEDTAEVATLAPAGRPAVDVGPSPAAERPSSTHATAFASMAGAQATTAALAATTAAAAGTPSCGNPGAHRLTRMGQEACAAAAAVAGAGPWASGIQAGSPPGGSLQGGNVATAALDTDVASTVDMTVVADSGQGVSYPISRATSYPAGGAMGVDEDEEPPEGRPIGIITIEDVIEELIRAEIVDETDRYVDNNRLIRVNTARLAESLPEHLAKVLAMAGAGRRVAATSRHRLKSFSGSPGSPADAMARRSLGMGLGLGQAGSGAAGSGAGASRDTSSPYGQVQVQQQQQDSLRVALLHGD